jgi:hypothetical protein
MAAVRGAATLAHELGTIRCGGVGRAPPAHSCARGPPSQNQLLALAVEESADTDTTVTTSREAWS